jgi:hypothetical protein
MEWMGKNIWKIQHDNIYYIFKVGRLVRGASDLAVHDLPFL